LSIVKIRFWLPGRFVVAGFRGGLEKMLSPTGDRGFEGRAHRLGVADLDRKYKLLDLASGDVMFAATGVTNGTMLRGVRRFAGGASTHSVVMRSKTGTVRYVEARHDFTRKQPSHPSPADPPTSR
jgi:fructose-1,6-bisphosphatase/sedoheptulose 1,7-bisphosphatase-like protein